MKNKTPKVTLSQLRAAMDVLKALGVQEFGEADGDEVYKPASQKQIEDYSRILKNETNQMVEIPVELLESLLQNCRNLRDEWSWKGRDSKDVIRLTDDIEGAEIFLGGIRRGQ